MRKIVEPVVPVEVIGGDGRVIEDAPTDFIAALGWAKKVSGSLKFVRVSDKVVLGRRQCFEEHEDEDEDEELDP